MGAYYYLMAQLPYLMYDQKPSMSSEAFKELALSLLSKKDGANMKYLTLGFDSKSKSSSEDDAAANDNAPEQNNNADKSDKNKSSSTGCTFIDSWREWERTMRLSLARHRSLKLYKDVTDTVDPPVVSADAYAASAIVFTHDGSPLERELLLDKARWAAIESLTGNDFFHHNNVYAYYLKLLILERHQLFNAEFGFAEYKSLYSEIIESSHKKSPESLNDKKAEESTGETK